MTELKVYLIYHHQDKSFADKLENALKTYSISVKMKEQFNVGENIVSAEEKAIISAKYVIVLWSNNSINSAFLREQASKARDRGVLIPVLVHGINLPLESVGTQAANLIGWDGNTDNEEFLKLQKAIQSKLYSQQLRLERLQKNSITILSLIVAIITAILTFTIPETRCILGLEQCQKTIPPPSRSQESSSQTPTNSDASTYIKLGDELKNQNKLDEAISMYRKAISVNSKEGLAYTSLGNALKEKGKTKEAILQLRQGVSLNPENVFTHISLGNALNETDQIDEAIKVLYQAINVNPKDGFAHTSLGNALIKVDKKKEAILELRQGISLKPDDSFAHTSFGNALSDTGQIDEAIKVLYQAINVNPKDGFAHTSLGNALIKAGKTEEAILRLKQGVSLKPDDGFAYTSLGRALCKLGKAKDAISELQEAVRLKPNDNFARTSLENALKTQCNKVD